MKKTGLIGALAALSLVLSACSGGGNGNGGTANGGSESKGSEDSSVKIVDEGGVQYLHADYDDLKQGGELTFPIGEITQQQNNFHQEMTNDTRLVWDFYNAQMVSFDGAGNFSVNPNYLTSAKAEEVDGKTVVTYDINPDATFNDGTPLDYKAFKTTWEANNGSNDAYLVNSTDGYVKITSVEPGTSDKQVVVTFDGPYAWWQGLFSTVLHPAVNTPELFNEAYVNQVHPEWGIGPYKVENFDISGGQFTFVPNEKWWGKPAKLDRVIFRQMESQATINAFTNRETDYTRVSTQENIAAVQGMSGINIYTSMKPANYLMTLNSDADAFSDPIVREAVMKSIDRKSVAEVRFQGTGYTEALPGSFVLFGSQEGYEDNFGSEVSYDPEGAKALLEGAGYTKNANGIFEKDGKALTARYVLFGDSALNQSIAQVIQAQLRALGVDMQIDSRPSAEFSKVMSEKDFDMLLSGFASSDPFGVAYFGQVYYSPNHDEYSGLNKSGTGSDEFDAKITEMTKIADPQEQIKRANELEKEAFDFYGIMPMFNGPAQAAMDQNLANYSEGSFRTNLVENIGYVENGPHFNALENK